MTTTTSVFDLHEPFEEHTARTRFTLSTVERTVRGLLDPHGPGKPTAVCLLDPLLRATPARNVQVEDAVRAQQSKAAPALRGLPRVVDTRPGPHQQPRRDGPARPHERRTDTPPRRSEEK